MTDIKKILSKKRWTGEDLGKLELATASLLFKKDNEKEDPAGVSDSQLREMVHTLTSQKQKDIYNSYIRIHEWIIKSYTEGQGQLQQALYRNQYIYTTFSQALMAEEARVYSEMLPAIMTDKQYEDLKADSLESFFTDEDGQEIYCNVFDLLARATAYFSERLEQAPRDPNPLKEIQAKYVGEPVRSELILERWNSVRRDGYYSLPDGRRSDQLTKEDWESFYKDPTIREALAGVKATDYEGVALSDDDVIFLLMIGGKAYFSSIDESKPVPFEWHSFTEPPANLTKWEVVESNTLEELYPAPIDGEDPYTEANFTASMEDFQKEFPELVDILLKEIDKAFLEGKEELSGLPVSEWRDRKYSLRDLYTHDFFGVKEEAEADKTLFKDNAKATHNGVAIVRSCDTLALNNCHSINDKGYYQEPPMPGMLSLFTLDTFSPESDKFIQNIEQLRNSEILFLDSYYFLKGYNYVIDQMAVIYDVPELDIFKYDLENLEGRADVANNALSILHNFVRNSFYSDKREKAEKLKVLDTLLFPVNYKSLEIPERDKEKITVLLSDNLACKKRSLEALSDLLYNRPYVPTPGSLETM